MRGGFQPLFGQTLFETRFLVRSSADWLEDKPSFGVDETSDEVCSLIRSNSCYFKAFIQVCDCAGRVVGETSRVGLRGKGPCNNHPLFHGQPVL